ncbi:hypothetical protein ABW02_20630 [Niallia circulans]|uniref:histidine kinase n=1 Tax=Niallia circulans TaxID=1397 RepID=A0A0J1IAA6_NIACI|nr:methyl-accepting chemotaxis protein [Niallia circulans]KLV22889.1 hypothetical protein ABW02_20630 [Niallia circulans]
MKGNNLTLRKKFLFWILSVLLIISLVSGAVQLISMKNQIISQTNQQAKAVANDVIEGIVQTDLSTKAIEQQIDHKMIANSKHIATLLSGKSANQMSQAELVEISDRLGLAGISIFKETKDDILVVSASDEEEIGWSLKEYGYYEVGKSLLTDTAGPIPGSTYADQHTIILPIAQSAVHEKPTFFKYAYYHAPNTDFIINPYIEANEVYDYTDSVGPDTRIKKLIKENNIVKEIAVLNPKVFANPSLETQLYPPLKKVVSGSFELETKRDTKLLIKSTLKKQTYIEKINGERVYKLFLPLDEDRIVYLALDYGEMSGPLYRHSIILIISGLLSLLVLIFLTARFFNRIYDNIFKIKNQIERLEDGDLTAKSNVLDGTELESLSQSTNRMVDELNKLVKDTQKQAAKTQLLSVQLEEEASNSVEKIYELSTVTTINAREQLLEITTFLDEVAKVLQKFKDLNHVSPVVEKIELMRQIANDRTAATTDMTITLSDLLKSLHGQSSELSDISNTLLESISKFKL